MCLVTFVVLELVPRFWKQFFTIVRGQLLTPSSRHLLVTLFASELIQWLVDLLILILVLSVSLSSALTVRVGHIAIVPLFPREEALEPHPLLRCLILSPRWKKTDNVCVGQFQVLSPKLGCLFWGECLILAMAVYQPVLPPRVPWKLLPHAISSADPLSGLSRIHRCSLCLFFSLNLSNPWAFTHGIKPKIWIWWRACIILLLGSLLVYLGRAALKHLTGRQSSPIPTIARHSLCTCPWSL